MEETGAILRIMLAKPLDITKACTISPFEPAKATVLLGPYDGKIHVDCVLDVNWPTILYPDPVPFKRSKTRR